MDFGPARLVDCSKLTFADENMGTVNLHVPSSRPTEPTTTGGQTSGRWSLGASLFETN